MQLESTTADFDILGSTKKITLSVTFSLSFLFFYQQQEIYSSIRELKNNNKEILAKVCSVVLFEIWTKTRSSSCIVPVSVVLKKRRVNLAAACF